MLGKASALVDRCMGWTTFEVANVAGMHSGVLLRGTLATHGSLSEVTEGLKIDPCLDAMNVESV